MLEIAQQRAEIIGRPIELRGGDAQALEFEDESFDTVVSTLSLCTIPDPSKSVAEARRVLRATGQLLLLEHVRSPVLPVRVVQRVLDPLFVHFEADHLPREPLEDVIGAGFIVEQQERSRLGLIERIAARKPAGAAVV